MISGGFLHLPSQVSFISTVAKKKLAGFYWQCHCLLWYYLLTYFLINISCFSLHLGPRYPDKGRMSYTPGPYVGPPCEPTRLPGQGWRFPPRTMNHRNAIPYRPPFEGPIPVAGRGV